jgi:Na+-driven multidrug efflux pump
MLQFSLNKQEFLLEEDPQCDYNLHDFELSKPTRPRPSRCEMVKHFSRLAGPSIVTNVFSYMVMTVNTIFAGQFAVDSAAKLAGVGLGSMVLGMFCRHVLAGVNCA